MNNNDNKNLYEELASVIYDGANNDDVFSCVNHPAESSAAACRQCGKPLCMSCFVEAYPRLICSQCRSRQTRKKIIKGGIEALRRPAIWVLICLTASGIAYACGVGNPSISQMKRQDADREWYRQETPMLYIAKANRQRRRAVALDELNRRDEARKWNEWAMESLNTAAELWQGTPAENIVKVAEAKAMIETGEYQRGINIIEPLKLEASSPMHLARLYYLGLAYEKMKNQEKAVHYFDMAYRDADTAREKALDNFLDNMLGSRKEGNKFYLIAYACDVVLTPAEIFATLSDYDLPSNKRQIQKAAQPVQKETREPQPVIEPSYKVEKVR